MAAINERAALYVGCLRQADHGTVDFSSLRICVTMSVRACVSVRAVRAWRESHCVSISRTHGTHSYSRTLMVTQIRSELKSTVATFFDVFNKSLLLIMLVATIKRY